MFLDSFKWLRRMKVYRKESLPLIAIKYKSGIPTHATCHNWPLLGLASSVWMTYEDEKETQQDLQGYFLEWQSDQSLA